MDLRELQNSAVLPWLNQSQAGGISLQDIIDSFGGYAATTYPNLKGTNTKRTGNIADELARLMRAQYDPNSQMYQNAFRQNKQGARNSIAEFLAEAGNQNRKLSSMGRTALFDPERGGEVQFRAMMKGYQDLDKQAHDQTLNQLSGAASSANPLYLMQQKQAQTQDNNRKRKGLALGDIAKALPTIMGMF